MCVPEENAMHFLDVHKVYILLFQLYRFVTETESEYGYHFLIVLPGDSLFLIVLPGDSLF